jgi:aldose 1-epimerase
MGDAPIGGDAPRRTMVLEADHVRVEVDPVAGGRLASVVVEGHELLVTGDQRDPIQWGSYPMAPWAGRIRHGRFSFAGREWQLPITMPPHAIHGVAYDRPWTVTGPDEIALDMDDRWPFRGRLVQRFVVDPDGLEVSMRLEAAEPQPAVLGWHPWFRRVIADGAAPVELAFEPSSMLLRDDEGIPTGALVSPPAGPWDDCFTGLRSDPVLLWPGLLRLTLSSTCGWWVVYSQPEHAVCVEPQSGPPDAVTIAPQVVEPGAPLVHRMRWAWERLQG